MIFFFRSVMKRSMMSATAMIEAISKGQIGQPAALMISNNCFPSHDDGRHFSLRTPFQQGGGASNAERSAACPSPIVNAVGPPRHSASLPKTRVRLSTFPVDKRVHEMPIASLSRLRIRTFSTLVIFCTRSNTHNNHQVRDTFPLA